ncbi:uncharacterized protein [Physcomitrium patens]|nr:uncharacterized protein LOC112294747 isoform X2 [Physcomitrium patens]|eukprot:XP_024401295.1 uncharacterized protein LOC112294747 isoform X2 [Physcomitrella patens]
MNDTNSESRAQAGRILTPQREYPIFTPSIRESLVLPGNVDQSRASFQDEGQGIWKEIHTDTQSTSGHSSRSLSFNTSLTLTPSVSAISLEQPTFLKPRTRATSPGSQYMDAPAAMVSSSTGTMLPLGRVAMNQGNNFYVPVPSNAAQRNNIIPGRTASPVTRAAISHSPQNFNILSPQLRPLEKSPKLTQLHVASPCVTESGGMTPIVNHLTLSPEHTRPGYDVNLNDPRMSSNNMLPPASVGASTMTSPAHGSLGSTTRLKKIMKSRHVEQSPRPSVSKDRSPGRTWRKSSRAVSPNLASIRDEAQNATRSINREMNKSFQGNAVWTNSGCVNSSSLTSWRGSGHDSSQLVVSSGAVDRDMSQDSSIGYEPPELPQKVGGKKVASTQKSGTYNIFNFLSWGKKKSGASAAAIKLNESFQSDMGSVKADSDSIKVLDYTIKTLRHKLELANQKNVAAAEEIRALQAAAEVSDEKCRLLTQRCQDLELQLSARHSGLWDMELAAEDYLVGRREHNPPAAGPPAIARRFSPEELRPEKFLKAFEDSKNALRRLASAICHHIRESGESATQVITSLLEQHKVGRWVSRMPRNVIILYFESFLNQVMFESFENVSFEPNGASSVFDPETLKQTCYQSYQNLKNQEWSTIEKSLGKPGALVVNANFHRFFVVRMELILSQLGKLAESEISLSLMASFFNAVKSVWLVHHLAFAFDQPVSIFRVSPSAEFDPRFMDQVPAFEEEPVRSKISIMVNPGFIVNRQTIKCQVYCSSKY